MAAEMSAATYRLFANAMHNYGRPAAEQRYLGQAGRAFENPLAQRPGGTQLNFAQGQNGPRFDYNQQIANRYPNAWGMTNPGDTTRAPGFAPVMQAPGRIGGDPRGIAAPQIGTWSSQAQPPQPPLYNQMGPIAPQISSVAMPQMQPATPGMQSWATPSPALHGLNAILDARNAWQAQQPQFSPNQMLAMQNPNSRTWGPTTSPYLGLGNYPVTAQGQPAPGNPALNGGWGGLPK